MKYLLIFFVFLSYSSFAQKNIFSLLPPLNLEVNQKTVDMNPTFNFDVFQSPELVSCMQRNEMHNIPLVLNVSSNGLVLSVELSLNASLNSFVKCDAKQLNTLLDNLTGLNVLSTPALKNGKSVAFETTIVLMIQQNNLYINPILHD